MTTTTDTRQRLIESARDLIYASSYGDVGVQQICARAGVKKGSFYHFFPSKVDLTLAVLGQFQQFFKQTILERAFTPDVPPLARIERFFSLAYEFQQQVKDSNGQVQGCPFGNLACEMSTQDEVIRSHVDAIFRDAETYFSDALAAAVANGDLPAIDTAATAAAIFAYAEGVLVYAKTRNDPAIIRELGKFAIQLATPKTLQ